MLKKSQTRSTARSKAWNLKRSTHTRKGFLVVQHCLEGEHTLITALWRGIPHPAGVVAHPQGPLLLQSFKDRQGSGESCSKQRKRDIATEQHSACL